MTGSNPGVPYPHSAPDLERVLKDTSRLSSGAGGAPPGATGGGGAGGGAGGRSGSGTGGDDHDDRQRDRGSDPSDQVVSLLERRGLSRPVAEKVRAAGRGLLDLTRREGIEFGLTVDLERGDPVGSILRGSGHDLDFAPHHRLLRVGGRYISLHTHPASTPPSHLDFTVLTSNPAIQMLVVLGADGMWYVLSRNPAATVDDQTARTAFAAAFAALQPRYQRLARTGRLTPQQALTALLDRIWQTIAAAVGVRYDRVQEVP